MLEVLICHLGNASLFSVMALNAPIKRMRAVSRFKKMLLSKKYLITEFIRTPQFQEL